MTTADNCEKVQDLGDGCSLVKHPSGIVFKYDPANGFEATAGLSTWGARLERFQFNTIEGLKSRIEGLHNFGEGPVLSQRTGQVIPTHKEIFNVDTGEGVSVMTNEYQLLQNAKLFGAFAKVAEDNKLMPIGRIDVGDKGFTLGYSTFMNPEFTITLLEQYPEPVAMGLEFRNSFAGQMGVMGNAWGFQAVCKNFCQWGQLIGSFWIPHNSDAIKNVESITESYVKNILDNSPVLRKTCSDAESDPVDPKDLFDILSGTNLPWGIIEDISANPKAFNKRLETRDLTMFQVYCCATNGTTFRESKAYRSTLSYTEGALKLLTVKQDKLIEDGIKRSKAYADAVSKQQGKRDNARKVAVEVMARQVA